MFLRVAAVIGLFLPLVTFAHGNAFGPDSVWIGVHTPTKFARSRLVDAGIAIDNVVDETSYAFVNPNDLEKIRALGFTIEKSLPAAHFMRDFPPRDSAFHNFAELTAEMRALANQYGAFLSMFSIGKSIQNRDIWAFRFNPSGLAPQEKSALPAIVFMGAHHAREHLSVEIPFMLAKYLAENNGRDSVVTELLRTREIFIIPLVNPDGAEWDISSNTHYQYWRKSRRVNANTDCIGVDLNRNYGHKWGTGGSSTEPCSDIYMGPQPFSEPETLAIKNFVESRPNLKVLLSFHTFSELILYPWGHKYDPVENVTDRNAYESMARTMAGWNRYTPQQASDLYIASGDTADWAWGALGIYSFTFELSPSSMGGGGFYPGAGAIDPTFRANLRPMLYLIDLADNPQRAALQPQTTLFFGR